MGDSVRNWARGRLKHRRWGEVVGEGSWGCLGAGTHLASMDQTARKTGACDAEPPLDAAALAPARGVDAFFFFAFMRAGRETRDAR